MDSSQDGDDDEEILQENLPEQSIRQEYKAIEMMGEVEKDKNEDIK